MAAVPDARRAADRRLKASGMALALGALVFSATYAGTRRLLRRFVLPDPGRGPDAEARENGFFVLHQRGVWPDGEALTGRVSSRRDPGYGSTSRMLGEAGVCLARDPLAVGGGTWTPATALGQALLARLQGRAEVRFDFLTPSADGAA